MSTAVSKRISESDLSGAQQKVLAVALHLFTSKGYFNTSVHDIARAAKVSIGSIYHHFQDKEGIAKALFDDLVARMQRELEEIMARHASTHDRCRAVVELLFRMTEEAPEMMSYMLHARHNEFMPGEMPVCSSKPFATMRQMVSDGMERGEVRRMEPIVAATSLFGGPIRMITLRLEDLLERPLPDYLDEVWTSSWRSIAA